MSTIVQHQVACNATASPVTFYATLSNENIQLKKLGNWVKKHREKMNFSQETAADKVGLSRYQWIRIENGQSGTKRETIISIAKELRADETEGLTLLAGLEPQNSTQNRTQLANGLELVGIDEAALATDDWHEISAIIDMKIERSRRAKPEKPNISNKNSEMIPIPDKGALDDEMKSKKKKAG